MGQCRERLLAEESRAQSYEDLFGASYLGTWQTREEFLESFNTPPVEEVTDRPPVVSDPPYGMIQPDYRQVEQRILRLNRRYGRV